MSRLLVVLAGLFGTCGVALAAAAAHRGGNLAPASAMLLAHAPALMALAALLGTRHAHRTLAAAAGLVLAAGTALFAGDLVLRAFLERGLFPMAAPTGGFAMMAGWLLAAAAGLVGARADNH